MLRPAAPAPVEPALRRAPPGRRPPPVAAVVVLALLVGLVVLVRVHVATPVRVSSQSMTPTLQPGDVVLVTLGGVDVDDLRRGELVTFRNPQTGEESLKRVVALPGQTVAVIDAVLHVDGRPVDEPYVDFSEWDGMFTARVSVPEGSVYLLGDNRVRSVDSRDFGPVAGDDLHGRVLVRLWPPVRLGADEPRPPQD